MDEQQEIKRIYEEDFLPTSRLAVFNRTSRVFVGMMNTDCKDHINEKFFISREITIDETTQKFIGDYETGQVVDIDSAPVDITEEELNFSCGNAINNVYPIHRQVNAMVDLLRVLVNNYNVEGPEVDEFNKVFDFIAGRRNLNKKFKKAYESGPDWNYMTTEQIAENWSKCIDGGIHEEMGPRSLSYMPCGLDGD